MKDFGWSAHFQAQLGDGDADAIPLRVLAVHRDALEVAGPGFEGRVTPFAPDDDDDVATVGDWLLVDAATHRPLRVLERGYAIVYDAAGNVVRAADQVAPGDSLAIQLARGRITTEVKGR